MGAPCITGGTVDGGCSAAGQGTCGGQGAGAGAAEESGVVVGPKDPV